MNFDLQPTLRGQLVHLRPLRPDDFDALFAVASDPLIWEQHPARDRCQLPVFREFFQAALDSGGALLALDASTGAVIGSSRYHNLRPAESEVEIGFTFLARSHWGGKYNGEVKRLMLDHAFHFVARVAFQVGQQNFRSQRAVQKVGGSLAGTRRNARGEENLLFFIQAARPRLPDRL